MHSAARGSATLNTPTFRTLDDWIAWMESLHPREIELGLERVREVQRRMDLERPEFAVVAVAGTNGKGSVVAMLEAILGVAGYRVGAYTSPHLQRYNERVRIAGHDADDASLCEAFEDVESARGATSLTYFEFGTLGAVSLFRRHAVDIALLEVGLGGRLDAVNAFDAEVSIVTAIDIDHTEWLGPDRESIGREKAGIFRAGRPAICSDPAPPSSIAAEAGRIGACLYQMGRDFRIEAQGESWCWRSKGRLRAGLPHPAMRGGHQLYNAAAALTALDALRTRFPITQQHVREGLLQARLPARLQLLPGRPLRVLDVAHNAQAARELAGLLSHNVVSGRTLAVVGMMRDKQIREVLRPLYGLVDRWYCTDLAPPRGARADALREELQTLGDRHVVSCFSTPVDAYAAARRDAAAEDRVVVFGSFHTVGDILRSRMD